MSPKSSRFPVLMLKFAVPIAILGWLLWQVDESQWKSLREQPKDYGMLGLALAVSSVAILLSFLRWGMLVRGLSIPIRFVDACRLGAIGFLLSFVSAGSVGGDLFKAFFLSRRSPGRRVEAVASVLVDRIIGLYGLVLVVALVSVWREPSWTDPTLRTILGTGTILAVVATLALVIVVAGGKWLDRVLPSGHPHSRFWRSLHRLANTLRLFHDRPGRIVLATLLSMLVHALLATGLYWTARGLYSSPPTLKEHLLIGPVGNLAAALPISPAGLGVFEAAIEWLYRIVPAQPTVVSGTLVALVFEVVKILQAAAGVIFYWTGGSQVRQAVDQVATASPPQASESE